MTAKKKPSRTHARRRTAPAKFYRHTMAAHIARLQALRALPEDHFLRQSIIKLTENELAEIQAIAGMSDEDMSACAAELAARREFFYAEPNGLLH